MKSNNFVTCCGGVFVFYLANGYLMEAIFRHPGFSDHGWFFTLLQYLTFVVLSSAQIGLASQQQDLPTTAKHKKSKSLSRLSKDWIFIYSKCALPNKLLFVLSLLTLVTVGLSTVSIAYINYPTQLLFKSCKVVPVIIGSIFIQGQRHSPLQFIGAGLISVGMIFFTLADSKVLPNFNPKGLLMVAIALLADAAIGNFQERAMRRQNLSNSEVVYYSYAFGTVFLMVILAISGHLLAGWMFYNHAPLKLYSLSIVYSASGYVGLLFLLKLIESYGAVLGAIVTTSRKAVTIFLSFLLFSKPFTEQYIWSGLLVFLGIGLCLAAVDRSVDAKLKSLLSRALYLKQSKSTATLTTV